MPRWIALICAALVLGQSDARSYVRPQSIADGCAVDSSTSSGDADLYCIELLPAGDLQGPLGTARLLPPSSPFGIAVTPAGEHLFDVGFALRNLPDPATLGPYSTYIAWATTPQLEPSIKLGEVRNGEIGRAHV